MGMDGFTPKNGVAVDEEFFTVRFYAGEDAQAYTALNEAKRYLTALGYSVGSVQRGAPIAAMYGDDWVVQKWRNLSASEKKNTHATISPLGSRGFRGDVSIHFSDCAPVIPCECKGELA